MLRLIALILLLANGLYFAWGHGLLLAYGLGPAMQGEPQRMDQQITPGAVRVLTPKEFQDVQEALALERAPKDCLQAGPFNAAQSATLRAALGSLLPADSWTMEESALAARWIVYMGKYPSQDVLLKKRAEVQAMGLAPQSLDNSSLEPGFSLGGFASKADAESELARLTARGLHTAHVVQEREASLQYELKLPAVDPALTAKLADVRSALGSQSLHSCN